MHKQKKNTHTKSSNDFKSHPRNCKISNAIFSPFSLALFTTFGDGTWQKINLLSNYELSFWPSWNANANESTQRPHNAPGVSGERAVLKLMWISRLRWEIRSNENAFWRGFSTASMRVIWVFELPQNWFNCQHEAKSDTIGVCGQNGVCGFLGINFHYAIKVNISRTSHKKHTMGNNEGTKKKFKKSFIDFFWQNLRRIYIQVHLLIGFLHWNGVIRIHELQEELFVGLFAHVWATTERGKHDEMLGKVFSVETTFVKTGWILSNRWSFKNIVIEQLNSALWHGRWLYDIDELNFSSFWPRLKQRDTNTWDKLIDFSSESFVCFTPSRELLIR